MQGIDIDQAAFIKFKRNWYLDQISLVKPVMPVLAIAREAQRRGIPMAIASGGGREHVLGAICANDLQSMFGAFICAEVRWHACVSDGLPCPALDALAGPQSPMHVTVFAALRRCWTSHMQLMVVQDYTHSKPAPDCFLMAAEKIGVLPEHCVGYEDAVLGMQSIKYVLRLGNIYVRV